MRNGKTWIGLFLAILMLAACAEAPTAPGTIRAGSAAPARGGGIILEPVIFVGESQCDPYLDLDWCQGEDTDCMTGATGHATTLGGCPAPGTGIGKGGAPIGSPDGSGVGADPDKYDDDLASNCPGCGERAATADEKATMEGLLSQVTCADGRSTLAAMIADGSLQVYTQDNGLFGAWNSTTQTIYISRPKHWNTTTGAVNGSELIDTMVHEVVHKLLGHTNGPQRHDQAWKDKMGACGFPQP